ncbi:MAG: hypothetical protein JO041_10030, partial [Acidobacteria bacterium]|nr:hypothetical protein [Acidobacteriota bacterium]
MPALTIDEELTQLEESLRRLKVEYATYFGGGMKRPPVDTEWRVKSLIARHQDCRLTHAQHYRYKSLAQGYAIFADLWRKKMKVREQGYRRPQDALLGVQGVRTLEEHEAARGLQQRSAGGLKIECVDPAHQHRELRLLYRELLAARKRNNEDLPRGTFASFRSYVERKTEEVRRQRGCNSVEFAIE